MSGEALGPPAWIVSIGSIALGAVLGSFLNVCIHRIPEGQSIVTPPSHCPHCGARIRWHDNVPVLGYLLLRGRCRDCGSRIRLRYPAVELLTAALCFTLQARYGLGPAFGIYLAFACALIVITFIDLDHQIIPNTITYPGIPLGVAASLVLPEPGLAGSLIGAALGGGVLLAVALAFEWLRKKEGMGLGDVKLLAMIGAFLGWKAVILTLVSSAFLGAVIGYAALRLSGKDAQHPIPYGPFLAVGAMTSLLWGDAIMAWYLALGER
jgi:leader peptidase (prepilin peptidase)/N-methyltransferase